ncbi:MAG: transcription elongation factor GreA [Firmicutes bacterium]|nr:transcription elongation factor GreA [Bacillota bacterium]
MIEKEYLLTEEGLKQKEAELEYLKTVKRREVAARIKQALEFGDISENSEYDDAKNEQAFIEGRIAMLEKLLRNAKIIDSDEYTEDVVSMGHKVRLRDLETGVEEEYMLVSSAESDPDNNKISNESPVGKAILGKKIGTVVDVQVPIGVIQYEIVSVSRV